MKLGTENKKKTLIAGALAVVAIFLLIHAFSGGGDDSSGTSAPTTAPASSSAKNAKKKPARTLLAHSLDPTLRFDLLKSSEDVTYKGNGRNIFSSQAAPPPQDIPQVVTAPMTPDTPPPPPPPPPSGLKFYGYAGPKSGAKKVFLIKGEDIFLAKEGDVVDRRYKIVHVGTTSVEVQDVLTNHTETIPLGAG
ncbi:MAG TPA: hypothetical protein VK976_07160 [Verrucomicrobiae bacterium]|nr:hypothetical protein [Verrucomicrobiae bacterium]